MFYRFSIFSRVLDAEMKEGTRLGIALANKKEETIMRDNYLQLLFVVICCQ